MATIIRPHTTSQDTPARPESMHSTIRRVAPSPPSPSPPKRPLSTPSKLPSCLEATNPNPDSAAMSQSQWTVPWGSPTRPSTSNSAVKTGSQAHHTPLGPYIEAHKTATSAARGEGAPLVDTSAPRHDDPDAITALPSWLPPPPPPPPLPLLPLPCPRKPLQESIGRRPPTYPTPTPPAFTFPITPLRAQDTASGTQGHHGSVDSRASSNRTIFSTPGRDHMERCKILAIAGDEGPFARIENVDELREARRMMSFNQKEREGRGGRGGEGKKRACQCAIM